jgi:outer membrane biosynthesis protein TonB
MSDTNFSYMEVSAKRKKRNQFISVLIIVAIVLLGVIVWGWIELQKSRNAERIKNALNSQVEPGFKEPEAAAEPVPVAPPDTGTVTVQDVPKTPEPVAAPEPVAPPMPEKPAKIAETPKPKKEVVKAAKPSKQPKAHVAKAPREHAAPVVPAKEPEQVAMVTPEPAKTPSEPAKAFAPEDLPMPEKAEPTEDTRQAMVSIPKGGSTSAAPVTSSNNFKMGLEAYKSQDYVNAIRSFTAVPTPASRKRGDPERDEYVQANFLKGLSLLKVGHMTEAVTSFQNVLGYEKYYPMANMNLGICYVELKQYAKAHQAFEAVVRDQSRIDPGSFDDVMQRTKYFWALAWTRLYKTASNPDKQNFYRQQAILKWKDYQVWFSKNEKYKDENLKAENYLKSLATL